MRSAQNRCRARAPIGGEAESPARRTLRAVVLAAASPPPASPRLPPPPGSGAFSKATAAGTPSSKVIAVGTPSAHRGPSLLLADGTLHVPRKRGFENTGKAKPDGKKA